MKLAVALLLLMIPVAAHASGSTTTMTRIDAMNAFNAIAAIGEYTTSAKQAGQDAVVKKYLDVALPVRSALTHDMTVLRSVAAETIKLQDDAKARLSGKELDAEIAAIAQQKISVDGLVPFAESDLQLDKNPQITPLIGSALELLEVQK